jgi:GDPmannose 4,6-dehydratase
MMQQKRPDDYVIATGRTVSVREMCQIAFAHAGLNAEDHVTLDPRFLRPAEVDSLRGDPSKAALALGWKAEVTLEELIAEMVEADLVRHRSRMG